MCVEDIPKKYLNFSISQRVFRDDKLLLLGRF